MAKSLEKIEYSSGNVFADLGLANASDLDEKVRMAVALTNSFRQSGLTQKQIASKLGITQPKVSALLHFKLEGFSLERLIHFLRSFGNEVEISVRAPEAYARPACITGRKRNAARRLPADRYRRSLNLSASARPVALLGFSR